MLRINTVMGFIAALKNSLEVMKYLVLCFSIVAHVKLTLFHSKRHGDAYFHILLYILPQVIQSWTPTYDLTLNHISIATLFNASVTLTL